MIRKKENNNAAKRAANKALKDKLKLAGNYTKEDEALDQILNEDDYEMEE